MNKQFIPQALIKYLTVLEKHIPATHTCSFLHETYKKKFYSMFKSLTRVFPSLHPPKATEEEHKSEARQELWKGSSNLAPN